MFLDKDGVINVDKGVSGNFEPVELYAHICDLIAEFKSAGFKIFVVTNQPVVARGLMSEDELKIYFEKFRDLILKTNTGAAIDKIYYCPHHPDANDERYRALCECRKPKPGMLLTAAREYGIDLKASYMIGDRMSDITAGSLAGCRTIHFLSGMHTQKAIISDFKPDKEIRPDYTINGLCELRSIIE
ncbi:MAG TPA: HAD family hydrolase [Candidatus Wallbacteria bacterium]|nr:HAD family hydrolase [Candidatus Wallbacteria bacterium]